MFELEEPSNEPTSASATLRSTQTVIEDASETGTRGRPDEISDPNDLDVETTRQLEKGKNKAEKSPIRKTRRYTIELGDKDEELLLTQFTEDNREDTGNLFTKVYNT